MDDHFYVCSNELLKSLKDGFDLRTAAAEYIIAFENLHTLPTEPIFKSLKATAELILKADKEDVKESSKNEFEENYQFPEGMGYLFALQHSFGEPTLHVWRDGLQTPTGGRVRNHFTDEIDKVETRHAVWPYYQPPNSKHPYQRHHFPFHEINYPLLRINAKTGNPVYVEMLRNWALKGQSVKEMEMEKHFFDTIGKKHPIVNGYKQGEGKSVKIIGDTQPNGTMLHHQHDLYERDYFRWLKRNIHREKELLKEGLSNSEMKEQLRKEHFEEKAKEWEALEGNEYELSENDMKYHSKRLGHLGYMLGLEWFNPDERTAVMKHLDEKGLKEHDLIELPNGQKFPTARLVYNALMRMTPELNWAIRPMIMMGRNANYYQEDNDKDYPIGESDMFHQQALGRLSHEPLEEFDNLSISQIIHNAIKDAYGAERPLKYLPKLNLNKNPIKPLSHEEIKAATKLHFKSKESGLEKVRMSKRDLMYLAGYDPDTGELMTEHPIYGNIEEPVVHSDMINYIDNIAKSQATLQEQIKDIRKHRAFFTSPYGPHPKEEKPVYWKEHEDGFTYGPSLFWSQPFQSTGGAGISPATYHEILNATHSGESENDNSPLTNLNDANSNYISANDINSNLSNHFIPLKTQEIGQVGDKYLKYGTKDKPTFIWVGKKFNYFHDADHIQNLLSPFGVSKTKPTMAGVTNKNNYTEHKSSLNPAYEYEIRHLTDKEAKTKINGPFLRSIQFPLSIIPTQHVSGYTGYGASPSDTRIYNNAILAHTMETLAGRMNHPHTPAKQSYINAKNWLRGDESASGGMSREEFADFMKWSGQSGFSYDSIENNVLNNSSMNHAMMSITLASKILGTQNPKEILEYLYGENHDELNKVLLDKSLGEFNKTKLNDGLKMVIKDMEKEIQIAKKNQKTKTTMAVDEKDAIERFLQFGNMIPASQKETSLLEEVEMLNQRLTEEEAYGTSPEELLPLRQQLRNATQQLEQIQSKMAVKKPTSHWEKSQNILDETIKGHRQTIAQVARDIILPKYLEHDPNAFNPNDPDTFIANHHQLMRDAQRYIASIPYSIHGITTTNYGLDTTIKPQTKGVKNPFHKTIAQHLSTDGKMIDGTMSVDKVLKILNIEKTPIAKEKAQELIDKSNEMNTPLFASTVKDILLSGKIPNIDGINLKQFSDEELMNKPEEELSDEERFFRHAREKGYHQALNHFQQQASGQSEWKGHHSHAIPRYMNMMLNPAQFKMSMASAGIGTISGDIHFVGGLGSSQTKASSTLKTKNNLDTIIHFDPNVLDSKEGITTSGEDDYDTAGFNQRPVGAPSPRSTSLTDNFDSGAWHHGFELTPTLGAEFDSDGNIYVGSHIGTGLYHSVPEELTQLVHGKDVSDYVYANASPPMYTSNPHQSMNMETGDVASENMTTIAASEMTQLITSLLDPDVLLTKSDDAKWTPPVRPMHRIFDLADLEYLRGFSGSWVVSKWYDGQRIIIVRNDDEITAYDENGRKKGLRKSTKEALDKMNDKNYTLDAILGENELNIIDIINYDDNNVGEMQLFERLKILRSQFDSQEHVIVPGPHDTRMTDDDGLADAVKNLKDEHDNILLRDNKSTYMKGERRHPKWILYRKARDFNFIVLDRRGNGPYTYQLGAGPILEIGGLGNRAIEYKGEHYMDVGTAHNQEKIFKVGDIVRASITGISKKNRSNRPVYNVQVKELEGEGEGEGAASTESLDLMTKSFAPILVPHDIQIHENQIKILLNEVDTVMYKMEEIGDIWYVHSPHSTMSGITKTNYPVVLAESLMPFWASVVPLMIKGIVTKMVEIDSPQKPTEKEIAEESAGILEEDDEERLLKPNQTKKALELIVRTLDKIAKEKMTWTGPKGLGIDVGTPQESPRGPTELRDEATLPDFDGEKKNTDERKEKKNARLNHIKVQTDEGENLSIDYDNDQPLLSEQKHSI